MAIEPCVKRDQAASLWDVVGPVCESGDWLGRDHELAVHSGDMLAVLSAGAYAMAMASNYNSRPRAAEVLIVDGQPVLIRERESVEELFARERRLPAR
jgi:diaminopimelate decarboxylase